MIIGFTGEKGSGKDTAASFLEDLIYFHKPELFVSKNAFATPLKKIIHGTFGISDEEAEVLKRTQVKLFNGLTLREVYQNLGESMKSIHGPDVWVNILKETIEKEYLSLGNNIIQMVTDVRYQNEQRGLEDFSEKYKVDFKLIKLVNLNQESQDDKEDNHISERLEGIKPDYIIEAQSVQEIEEKIKDIYARLFTTV